MLAFQLEIDAPLPTLSDIMSPTIVESHHPLSTRGHANENCESNWSNLSSSSFIQSMAA